MLAAWGGFGVVPAHAATPPNVVCSLGPGATNINFGSVNVSSNSGATGSGSIGYTCKNYGGAASFTLCAGIGNPSYPGSVSQPQMQYNANTLNFNLYADAADTLIWTTNNPVTTQVSIGASPNGGAVTVSGTIPFYGYIPGNQPSPAGSYQASFYNTVLGFPSGGHCVTSMNSNGSFSGLDFTLPVQASVSNACTVSAGSALTFPAIASGSAATTSSNTITVTCPSGTTYNVGLLPSNGNTDGSGTMKGSGGNADTVGYQLYSNSGLSTPWGNATSAATTGNGVHGNGSGGAQQMTVYARIVGNTDVTPDTYTDTVQIFLNY
jgi:spore coat protein U-like protein